MAVELFDNATSPGTSTLLSEPCADTDEIIQVRAPASSILQQPGGQFRIVVVDPTTTNFELMLVDSSSAWSAQWQVTRAIEYSEGPFAFPAGSTVEHILTAGALANLMAQGGVINPPPVGSIVEQLTVDTNQLYKIILFSTGLVKAIPAGASAPLAPQGLAVAELHLTFVELTWDTTLNAATYNVFRNGALLGTSTTTSYTDSTVVVGQTYEYTVQAVDQYSQPSPISGAVSADINANLDQAPVVSVTIFPNPVPAGTTAVVRVNSYSLDALALADVLSVNVGQLTATEDPTTWMLTV